MVLRTMSKPFSTSPLILGVIEDLEISGLMPFRYNYRYDLGDLQELSNSIGEKGLLRASHSKEHGHVL